MNYEEIYVDNEGKEFDFLAVSNPLEDGMCQFKADIETGKATRKDTGEEMSLYDYFGLPRAGGAGLVFTKTKEPFVLFQSVDDLDAEDLFVLPIHDFFAQYKKKK